MLYLLDIGIQTITLNIGGKMVNVFIALGVATVISIIFVSCLCISMIIYDKKEEYRLGKSKKSKKVNKRK